MLNVVLSLIVILISSNVYAEASRPISKLMNTPASAFDVFLLQLHEQSKCNRGWFGNQKTNIPKLCMTTIDYSYEDNLIVMNFFVDNNHDKMKGFLKANKKRKQEILEKTLSDLAVMIGVAQWPKEKGSFKLGLIQFIPIRRGWSSKNFNEDEIKEEISKRTVIHLRTKDSKLMYKVSRSHHGKVSFDIEKLKE